MPNCYFDVGIISRGGGSSAVARSAYDSGSKMSSTVTSAAYRSGEVLYDSRVGKTFDYTRKDDVLHTEILAPDNAPDWVFNRQKLWNVVEESEKRKDAQLARTIIAALPRELTRDDGKEMDYSQPIALVRQFVTENFVKHGMIADIAVHDKDASDGGRNPHVHIMLTLRDISPDGFDAKKNRAWNDPNLVRVWRDNWETTTNSFLEAAGCAERLSLKSYKEQGIDKTPEEHRGPKADNLEKRKHIETAVGDRNRKTKQENVKNDVRRSRLPEPYAAEAVESWYQSRWQWMVRIRESEWAAPDSAREGNDRHLVAEAEQSAWYGLGGSSRVSLYYAGHEDMPDDFAAARHRAVLEQVLGGTQFASPLRLAETVNRVADTLHETIERTQDNGHEYWQPYERHEPPYGQERER